MSQSRSPAWLRVAAPSAHKGYGDANGEGRRSGGQEIVINAAFVALQTTAKRERHVECEPRLGEEGRAFACRAVKRARSAARQA
jgi:hypothetical protein